MTSTLQINTTQLRQNAAAWKTLLQQRKQNTAAAKLCVVVKADGYGIGVHQIVPILASAGVDMFAVFSVAQAQEILNLTTQPILIMLPAREIPPSPDLSKAIAAGRLHFTVYDLDQLRQLETAAQRRSAKYPIHLFLDTGMSRGGLNESELPLAMKALAGSTHLQLAGIYSHLACAECDAAFTAEQFNRFQRALSSIREQHNPQVMLHIANTTAAAIDPRYHLDMVRIGLGMWGYIPDMPPGCTPLPELSSVRPILRWTTTIAHISRYPRGAAVGYGQTHRLARDSILGLVPVGYGDGYPRALGNRASVELLETRQTLPVLGRVNMDQIVIDLTDAPTATVGAPIVLVSDDPDSPCSLPRLAQLADSSCYELLCRLSPRLHRCIV